MSRCRALNWVCGWPYTMVMGLTTNCDSMSVLVSILFIGVTYYILANRKCR